MATKTVNTGNIQYEILNREQEYSRTDQEIVFTDEQHEIWRDLFAGVHTPMFLDHVCTEYLRGLEQLCLSPKYIPSVQHLNRHITPNTGWQIERTAVRYTKSDTWYTKFAQRTFLITDYLRTREQMEFTPEPDMFHDIFGHLPYLTLDFYARIEDYFAPAYFNATDEEREVIRRLAWYSTEFGLVMENNNIKVFGAGIISGRAEFASTIMEIYRLVRDNVIDMSGDVFAQLTTQFQAHEGQIRQIFAGINRLHQQGEMASADSGWNVINALYQELGIDSKGYLGGEVIFAPFELEAIRSIPKTVYAMNPVYFVAESFAQMEDVLASYLVPIAER